MKTSTLFFALLLSASAGIAQDYTYHPVWTQPRPFKDHYQPQILIVAPTQQNTQVIVQIPADQFYPYAYLPAEALIAYSPQPDRPTLLEMELQMELVEWPREDED
jgi:hypothetical protein